MCAVLAWSVLQRVSIVCLQPVPRRPIFKHDSLLCLQSVWTWSIQQHVCFIRLQPVPNGFLFKPLPGDGLPCVRCRLLLKCPGPISMPAVSSRFLLHNNWPNCLSDLPTRRLQQSERTVSMHSMQCRNVYFNPEYDFMCELRHRHLRNRHWRV